MDTAVKRKQTQSEPINIKNAAPAGSSMMSLSNLIMIAPTFFVFVVSNWLSKWKQAEDTTEPIQQNVYVCLFIAWDGINTKINK